MDASMERARKDRRAVIALAILLAFCPCAFPLDPSLDINQYAHTSWKISEGFTKGRTFSIAQTSDGYLWLGTEFGLLRFDGVQATPWQPPSGEHLPSSFISKLLVARDGTLWIGTHKGLASWKAGKLTQYPEVPRQRIDTLLEDREGTVWAGVEVLPYWKLCAIRDGKVQCYGEMASIGLGVGTLFEDRKGNLWAGTGTGLWRWKPGAPKLIPLSGPASEIHSLIEGDNGALLVATRGGIMQVVDGKASAYELPGIGQHLNPFRLLRDRDGGLWIGRTGLLHVHKGKTDQFTQPDGLSDDSVTDMFEDREGNVWVCTDNGLDRFRDFSVTAIPVKRGLASSYVLSVLPARDGSVWLGTRNGLDRWNDGRLTLFRKRRSQDPGPEREITDSGLPDDIQSSLFQDHRGRIWVFTFAGAAYLERGRFIPVPAMPGGYVHSIAEDSAGNLWISQDQGFFHLLRGGVVEQIPWARLGRQDLALALAADPLQGGLWLGFAQGGVTYFKDGQVGVSYTAAGGLGEGRVNSVHLDRDGTLWAATEGGLSRVKNGRVVTLSSQEGLPCNSVHEVMEDDAHSIWLYMACGLVRIARPELDAWATSPKRTIKATVFDNSDGVRLIALPGGLSPRVGKSADGRLWYLSRGGVYVVDPRRLDGRDSSFNRLPPPVHIEQVIADGKIYDASSRLRLAPLVRNVWINYTALSFVAPERVRFRYKLEGQDPNWTEVVNQREAQYTNLAPGPYRFHVIACNNSGLWNQQGDTLEFSVAPAYYQTSWFRVLCAVLVLPLLWAAYQWRLRQLHHQFEIALEARVGERTSIARELHDTLLQSFHGLLPRFQVVSQLLPERPVEAKEQLDGAIARAAKAIVEGRDAVQGLRASTEQTSDLALALNTIGEELATDPANHGTSAFRVTVEGEARNLHPILRDEIFRIAAEALRNAFRHAHAQQVEVEIRYDDEQFRLRVRDDGKGIDTVVLSGQGPRGHYGLPGMRERAKLIGGKLVVWSEVNAGTEVELLIPAGTAYATASKGSWLSQLLARKQGMS